MKTEWPIGTRVFQPAPAIYSLEHIRWHYGVTEVCLIDPELVMDVGL
jgi:hypothetical protein